MNKIEISKSILRLEQKERENHNSSEKVELVNGKVLTKDEQVAFFEKISSSVLNDEKKREKFKSLYKSGDLYGAWSNLLGNLWQNTKEYSYRDLPKKITVGICYYEDGSVSSRRVVRLNQLDGEYVSYRPTGELFGACIYSKDNLIKV